jgi:lipopolysaccharide transport protein LptA
MIRERPWIWVAALAGILFVCIGQVQFVSAQEKQLKEALPITITSDRMKGDFKAGIITFLDRVKVVRGDMVLNADQVTVHPKDGGDDIERIVATGNVRVISGSRSSVSDRVEYVDDTEVLILTGNAKVMDGKNTIAGPVIRVYLKEDRAEVEGNNLERPKFLFHPDTMKSQKKEGKE